jgi:hypothetical protein
MLFLSTIFALLTIFHLSFSSHFSYLSIFIYFSSYPSISHRHFFFHSSSFFLLLHQIHTVTVNDQCLDPNILEIRYAVAVSLRRKNRIGLLTNESQLCKMCHWWAGQFLHISDVGKVISDEKCRIKITKISNLKFKWLFSCPFWKEFGHVSSKCQLNPWRCLKSQTKERLKNVTRRTRITFHSPLYRHSASAKRCGFFCCGVVMSLRCHKSSEE